MRNRVNVTSFWVSSWDKGTFSPLSQLDTQDFLVAKTVRLVFQQTGSKCADLSASNSNSGTVIFRLSVNFYTIVITRVRELSRIQCDRRATKMQTVNRWIQVLWNLISTILTHSICPEYSGFLISRPLIQVRFCYFVELAEVVNPHAFIATTFFTPNPHPTHSSVSCALLSFNHLKCRLA